MIRSGLKLSAVTLLWIVILLALLILGSIFAVLALKGQHDIVNPQMRQNMADDPAKTLADRQDFHSKLGEIISADQNVITDIDQVERCEKTTPVCSNDNTLQTYLIGVEQVRNNTINAYNTKAANPDDNKYLESWMPKKIDVTVIPADYEQAKTFLQQEIDHLQSIYHKGV